MKLSLITALLLSSLPAICCAAQPAKPQGYPWVDIPQQQLVYLKLSSGVVVLQLADSFAPVHTQRFRELVKSGFYHGTHFYRVIDQFVLQAGLPEGEQHPSGHQSKWPALKAEFSWAVRAQDPYRLVQRNDLLASETGFNQGFAVGRASGVEWLINCPNVVTMARSTAPDSATTDFAIMQGQAPRHLDKNMSVFARVIWGGEHLNAVQRGERSQGGFIEPPAKRSSIINASLGSDLPTSQQLPLQMMDTQSAEFADKLQNHRLRVDAFYQDKGNGNVDICYQQIPVRVAQAQAASVKAATQGKGK